MELNLFPWKAVEDLERKGNKRNWIFFCKLNVVEDKKMKGREKGKGKKGAEAKLLFFLGLCGGRASLVEVLGHLLLAPVRSLFDFVESAFRYKNRSHPCTDDPRAFLAHHNKQIGAPFQEAEAQVGQHVVERVPIDVVDDKTFEVRRKKGRCQ